MNEEKFVSISDTSLDDVNGGVGMKTYNKSTYKSGDTPKFKKGDIVTIYYMDASGNDHSCTGKILDVSSDKCCGSICPEFGYKVQIISVSMRALGLRKAYEGKIYENVYESCLS